ncbi:hypothetical protein BJX76DRAFT_348504 [Aspergillus varians]
MSSPGVNALVNYYVPNSDGSPPATNDMAVVLGQKNMASHRMRIHDLWSDKEQLSLDRNGFQYAILHSKLTDFTDDSRVKEVYYKEIEELVKGVTGAKRVLAFNYAVRTKTENGYGDHINGRYQGVQGPTYRVHIDQTPQGALNTVQFMFPELAEELRNGNFQMIKVWRPLTRVQRDPLMVADAERMPVDDLILINRTYYNGLRSSNFIIKYGGQRAIGKEGTAGGYSSFRNGKAIIGAPHGAFRLPNRDRYPARQRIECRCVAIY